MILQHDTHYPTKKLDIRYVVKDLSQTLWSKHSLYNPDNIENTEEVSEHGTTYNYQFADKDLIPEFPLSVKRHREDYILLQNFELVNFYADTLIETPKKTNCCFKFLSNASKKGCVRVVKSEAPVGTILSNAFEFPMLAVLNNKHLTNKLENLIRCLQWI